MKVFITIFLLAFGIYVFINLKDDSIPVEVDYELESFYFNNKQMQELFETELALCNEKWNGSCGISLVKTENGLVYYSIDTKEATEKAVKELFNNNTSTAEMNFIKATTVSL